MKSLKKLPKNIEKEYLVTNALGGYCSSDPLQGNTRKYHGLLVVADSDLNRINLVNRLDERIELEGREFSLTASHFQNVFKTDLEYILSDYTNNSYPEWTYNLPGLVIQKAYVMERLANRTVVRYTFSADREATVNVVPLITYRNMHDLRKFSTYNFGQFNGNNSVVIKTQQEKYLRINYKGFRYIQDQDVYHDFFYPIEEARGYEANEDLLKPGLFQARIPAGHSEMFISFLWTDNYSETETENYGDYFSAFANRSQLLSDYYHDAKDIRRSKLSELLSRQTDQFVINTETGISVIAGYHWFEDWGRDTFLSFQGLFLTTNRFSEATNLLLRWSKLFKNGLLPNRPIVEDYNSIDAVFWYAVAVYEYYQATEDTDTVSKIIPTLETAFLYLQEDDESLSITPDGYLYDHTNSAMTWMDAKIDNVPVIDRSGKAVEIQGLWYNFLRTVIYLKESIGDHTHLVPMRSIAAKLERNFEQDFFNPDTGCLFDSIKTDRRDPSIRPNQVILLSLPYSLLSKRIAKRVLAVSQFELLTDYGLRTLSVRDNSYKGHYHGNQKERDQAYHQGTIWPFLLGIYVKAYLNVYSQSQKAKKEMQALLSKFEKKLVADGENYIAEIYDPNTMKPDGCISQAWSAATILEAHYLVNKK